MKILIDSDALIAIFNRQDALHQKASLILQKIEKYHHVLHFTNLVKQESATVISHRINMKEAIKYLKLLEKTIINQIKVEDDIELSAWEVFCQQTKKGCSFIDCSNIAVINKYHLDGIFSFDKFYSPTLKKWLNAL